MLLIQKALLVLDLVLFAAVVLVTISGRLDTTEGLIVLAAWVIVFMATLIMFTIHMSEGDQWYHYGILLLAGMLIAMIIGLVLGFDIYGIALMIPFAVMGMITLQWMFLDTSEDYFYKDLERLKRKIE
jgi:hypothetical protein